MYVNLQRKKTTLTTKWKKKPMSQMTVSTSWMKKRRKVKRKRKLKRPIMLISKKLSKKMPTNSWEDA